MPFSALPVTAAWQHRDARAGFEVAWFRAAGRGYHLSGCTTGAEDGQTWVISYAIELDQTWATRSARITGQSAAGIRHARLQADGHGHWRIDMIDGLPWFTPPDWIDPDRQPRPSGRSAAVW